MSRTPGDLGQGLTQAEYREVFRREAEQAQVARIVGALNETVDGGGWPSLTKDDARYLLRMMANAGVV